MADYTAGPHGGGAGSPAGKFVNMAAAAVSVALIGGVGVWGYKLLMRDVTGVPVVRAMQGDMRVAPENPGGEIAAHVGLAVNAVPAVGGAAEPEDRLVLAPSMVTLEAEDLEVTPAAEGGEVALAPAPQIAQAVEEAMAATLTDTQTDLSDDTQVAAVAPAQASSPPLTAEDVLALADRIAAGAAPLSDLEAGEDVPVVVSVNGVAVNPDIILDAVPGVRRSLRPVVRPVAALAPAPPQSEQTAAPATAQQASAAVTPAAAIPAGTKLVQLGAFDSAEIAAAEWGHLTGRFPDFFDGKDQVIQQAASGGRTFYRLRAMGFVDLSDARRFCAAMSAQGAACIPVVVR